MSRKIVNFMIIGVQKCGTTSLASIFRQHPNINFCAQKEPSFFSINDNWEADIDKYHDLFDSEKIGLLGEASTSYSFYYEYPKTAERLKAYNPNLKFIYIMRNPVERIRSHYQHNFLKGRTRKLLKEEVISNPTYINHSRYAVQIRPYIDLFGKKNIHFLTLEDFIKDKYYQLKLLSDFLSIDYEPFLKADTAPKNTTKHIKKVNFIRTMAHPFLPLISDDLKIKLKSLLYKKNKLSNHIDSDFKLFILNHIIDDINFIERETDLDLANWKNMY